MQFCPVCSEEQLKVLSRNYLTQLYGGENKYGCYGEWFGEAGVKVRKPLGDMMNRLGLGVKAELE